MVPLYTTKRTTNITNIHLFSFLYVGIISLQKPASVRHFASTFLFRRLCLSAFCLLYLLWSMKTAFCFFLSCLFALRTTLAGDTVMSVNEENWSWWGDSEAADCELTIANVLAFVRFPAVDRSSNTDRMHATLPKHMTFCTPQRLIVETNSALLRVSRECEWLQEPVWLRWPEVKSPSCCWDWITSSWECHQMESPDTIRICLKEVRCVEYYKCKTGVRSLVRKRLGLLKHRSLICQ
jgi:hypothetical protein